MPESVSRRSVAALTRPQSTTKVSFRCTWYAVTRPSSQCASRRRRTHAGCCAESPSFRDAVLDGVLDAVPGGGELDDLRDGHGPSLVDGAGRIDRGRLRPRGPLRASGQGALRGFGIPVSEGRVAPDARGGRARRQRSSAARSSSRRRCSRAGAARPAAIKLADGPERGGGRARDILGLDIRGHVVRRLLDREGVRHRAGVLPVAHVRPGREAAALHAHDEGGMDIEEVAATHSRRRSPGSTSIRSIGFQPFHARWLCFHGRRRPTRPSRSRSRRSSSALYRGFVECEAMLCEINPLDRHARRARCEALDAKVTIDDNALYRHPDLAELRDVAGADRRRSGWPASEGVAYVKLDGDIGILGNGAGLVMSTLDVVAQAGGARRTSATSAAARRRRRSSPRSRSSPPTRSRRSCSTSSAASRAAARWPAASSTRSSEMEIDVPIVVRLDGTEADEGRRLLAEARPGQRARRGRRCSTRPGASSSSPAQGLMAIIVDTETRLVVQGITGREGTLPHAAQPAYGTNVVAGVTPGKGGEAVEGIPVFDSVRDAVAETRRQHRDGLRPGALRRRRDLRGGRRRHRAPSSASPRASRPTTCSASTTTSGRAASR